MKRLCFLLCGIAALVSVAGAAPIFTFASFQERGTGGKLFEFVNLKITGATNISSANNPCGTGKSACGIFQTTTDANKITSNLTLSGLPGAYHAPDSVPVFFDFQTILGSLPPVLQGNLDAHMTMSIVTTANASTTFLGGSTYFTDQPFNLSGSISYTLDTPYLGLTNLLTVTLTPAAIGLSGLRGSGTANFNADTENAGDLVTFSSDFLNFGSVQESQVAMSFTSLSPCFTRITNGTCGATGTLGAELHSFAASGSGTFSASPEPRFFNSVPEPAEAFLIGAGLLLLGLKRGRRNRLPA